MDHQKSNFSLISVTLSVGGCWGQLMSFFWNLVDETQNLLTPEATRYHKLIKLLILVPLRSDLLCTLHYETPCIAPSNFSSLWTSLVHSQLKSFIQKLWIIGPSPKNGSMKVVQCFMNILLGSQEISIIFLSFGKPSFNLLQSLTIAIVFELIYYTNGHF